MKYVSLFQNPVGFGTSFLGKPVESPVFLLNSSYAKFFGINSLWQLTKNDIDDIMEN
jgi:hypothetical protein